MRNLALVALAAFLAVAGTSAALAQTGFFQYNQFHVPGTYVGPYQGGIMLRTSSGANILLPQGLSFSVGGTRVELSSLVPGTYVQALVPAGAGTFSSFDNGCVTWGNPHGTYQFPYQYLPAPIQKTRVDVRLANGNIVNVPLNAAWNMQRSQGARILTGSGNRGPHGNPGHPHKGRDK